MSDEKLLKSLIGDLWGRGEFHDKGAASSCGHSYDVWICEVDSKRVNVGVDVICGDVGVWADGKGGMHISGEEFGLGDPDLVKKVGKALDRYFWTVFRIEVK